MAKKRKKKHYRLRKSVRRTLGALFMITAIIIAAIPFPDAAATDGSMEGASGEESGSNSSDENKMEPLEELVYEITDDNYEQYYDTSINQGIKLKGPALDSSEVKTANTLRLNGDGVWEYEEQFKYYVLDNGQDAILNWYNDRYSEKEIILSETINNGNYVSVSMNDFDDYFDPDSDKTGKIVQLTFDDKETNPAKAERFKIFFPSLYQTYLDNIEDYEEYKTAYSKDPSNPDLSDRVKYPIQSKEDVTVSGDPTSESLSEGTEGKFYSTYVLETKYPTLKGKGLASSLEMIAVENPQATDGENIIYIARHIEPETAKDQNIAGFRFDPNGFLYLGAVDTYKLTGIAEDAFSSVKSSMTLTLPSSVLYIGDRAFKDSFVTYIDISEVKAIGNQAFMNSRLGLKEFELAGIKISSKTEIIGTEAFRNTLLTDIELPYSVSKIGIGAFAENENLTTISFESTNQPVEICDFAFYECPNLGDLLLADVAVSSIGKGAFAVDSPNSICTRFEFPNSISDGTQIGDHVLAGRKQLKEVVMSERLGFKEPATTLKNTIFKGCNGLNYVLFPDSCLYVEFDNNIFSEVNEKTFYVEGPALIAANSEEAAKPRSSTWDCRISDGKTPVPYVYDGHYEICQKDDNGNELLLLVSKTSDTTGILESCKFKPGTSGTDIDLVIPKQVGNITLEGIANGCFEPEFLDNIGTLKIEDGSAITEIGDSVFEGAENLRYVEIGDSVQRLGANVFKDCTSLTKIKFSEPMQGASSFPLGNIGTDAFTTGSEKLVIEGSIEDGYGPFEWAMQEDNYANKQTGVRVCYKSTSPTNLYVLLDNTTKLPTLVHYPHYGDLKEYKDSNGNIIDLRETIETNQNYLNDMDPAQLLALNATKIIDLGTGIESIDVSGYLTNEANGYNRSAYFADANDEDLKYLNKYRENYTKYGLFNGDCNDNTYSTATQKGTKPLGNDQIEEIYMPAVKTLPVAPAMALANESDIMARNGLASGAFYSCENLKTVVLSNELQDLGESPFAGCYGLKDIELPSDKYFIENNVIYENLDDGTLKLVQMLPNRGLDDTPASYSVETDSEFANVTEIENGAFADCPGLRNVDFTDNTNITEIPDRAFVGDKNMKVYAPEHIKVIGEKAFAATENVFLDIRSKDASLALNAFDDASGAEVKVYENSAAHHSALRAGVDIAEDFHTDDKYYTVTFKNHDGTDFEEPQLVKEGESAIKPEGEPKRDGYTFIDWAGSYENITKDTDIYPIFNSITGDGDNDGNPDNPNNPNDPNNPNNPDNNNDKDDKDDKDDKEDAESSKKYKLTVSNGEGSGDYKPGQTVTIKAGNAPAGTMFAYWSCSNEDVIFEDATDWITTLTMVNSDVTVIANYTGQYVLEVVYGSGSGSYPAGAKVEISAVDAPQGRSFASWVTKNEKLTIEDAKKQTTTITMPAEHAKVTATYMDKNSSNNSTNSSQNGTSIMITKPGISNTNQASAYVTGSTDNFIVKVSESLEAAEEVQKALQKKYPDMSRIKYFAMDISLYDAKGTNKITDTEGLKVNITMPIPDALKEYAGNNRVGAVANGELETLNPKFTTINGVPSISFTATHFSPYTIYVDTGNMTVTEGTLDSTPKTGDGIHPKWFLSIGLACISIILFTKKDRRYVKSYR